MKLSVDCGGSHSLDEECLSAGEVIDRLAGILDESTVEVKIVKRLPENGWHGQVYISNPVKTAYKMLLVLEEEQVPRICVDDIIKALKDILDYQEVIHTPRNERNPNFPR